MKKYVVIIGDDCEVMGNGLGNVADLQYLPALSMMNISDRYGAKVSFQMDVAHRLALKKFNEHSELRIQGEIWDNTALLIKERGHDVQLHLHAQWSEAEYSDGHFHLIDTWNICLYEESKRNKILRDAVDFLHDLIRPKFPDYNVCAFKAGSWAMQPSDRLLPELERLGINILMGMRSGLDFPAQKVNFSSMEEEFLPYYPDYSDVEKLSNNKGGVVAIPLQPYSPDLITLSRYIFESIVCKKRYLDNKYRYHKEAIPKSILNDESLVKGRKLFRLNLRPYETHLKIGNQPFFYLKKSFDSILNNLDNIDVPRIPILIESHTKQYHNHYDDIEQFIEYMAKNQNVEFSTLADFNKELLASPEIVRFNSAN